MTLLALKCLGIAWVLVILGFGAWIGLQVVLSWLDTRRSRRIYRGRGDVALVHDLAARWNAGTR